MTVTNPTPSAPPASDVSRPTAGTGRGAATRLPRGRRTVAAVIVALVLLLVAAFAGWQAVLVQAGRQPYPFDAAAISARLNQTPFSDIAVLVAAVLLILLALWLLLLSITPARRQFVELIEDHPDVATGIRPGDLRRALAGVAERVDGVSKATVSIARGSATVTVTSPLGNPTGLTETVMAALDEELRQLNLVDPVTPRVELTGRDR